MMNLNSRFRILLIILSSENLPWANHQAVIPDATCFSNSLLFSIFLHPDFFLMKLLWFLAS